MFDATPGWGLLVFFYVAGSISTYLLFYKSVTLRAIEQTIDMLCNTGYLRFKRSPNGEVEILKYDQEN